MLSVYVSNWQPDPTLVWTFTTHQQSCICLRIYGVFSVVICWVLITEISSIWLSVLAGCVDWLQLWSMYYIARHATLQLTWDLESKRHRHGPEETTCTITDMEYRIIRVRKLGAVEMWVWRRMLRISWTERKTNTRIREKIGIPKEKGMLEQIEHWKLSK